MLVEKKQFEGWSDDKPGEVFQNLEFNNCKFIGCYLNFSDDVKKRTSINNIVIKNSEQKSCTIGAAIIQNSLFENIRCNTLLQTWGASFQHVVFRKKIESLMISPYLRAATIAKPIQQIFDSSNKEFYSKTDWAIDISEAEFLECTISGIPSHLVIRDSESQVIVNRDKLINSDFKMIDYTGTYFLTSLNLFLEATVDDDIVLVAPKLDKNYSKFRNVIDNLVEMGIAVR